MIALIFSACLVSSPTTCQTVTIHDVEPMECVTSGAQQRVIDWMEQHPKWARLKDGTGYRCVDPRGLANPT